MAFTETHLGATSDEQIRWLAEAWRGAEQARFEGADVRAVTAWSLLGAHDWNSLVTRAQGHYEPGVFDVHPTEGPRPTALTPFVRSLATRGACEHASLAQPGWWRRPERVLYASDPRPILRAV